MANDCPEFLVWKAAKDKETARSAKPKAAISELQVFQVDESSSDSEYPIVPSIVLETRLQDTIAKNSLIDCGATVNLVDSTFVKKCHLRTYASHPIRVHQALSLKGAIANTALLSKVGIPSKNWKSTKPAKFIVTGLEHHDVILGMPFLAAERIKVDPANRDIILPECNAIKLGEELIDERDESRKIRAPRDLSEVSRLLVQMSPSNLMKSIDKDSEPTISPTRAAELSAQIMAEYPDVFTHKLPRKLPHPKAPRHRIILKDPNKSINRRLFALPERYLNSMIDWLEEELAAGRIRVSSSNMAAGT
jgi:hypothetical protein